MDMEDLPKAFLLAVICMDATSVASKQIQEKTYGKISQADCIRPWEELLHKLRVCLLVSLRLAGDVSPMGGVSPMTVKTVSQPDVFSTYAWIARDELSLSHDNQVIMALESACLSSSVAFYPSTVDGDTLSNKNSVLQSCSYRPSSALRNPSGLIDDSHSRPLLFYLKDHANCTSHLAAHRALILGGLWGQTPDDIRLLQQSIASLEVVMAIFKEFSLATLVDVYQSRIRPVCRALIFGFDDVHELSKEVVSPLLDDPVWLRQFSASAKKVLSMIVECMQKETPNKTEQQDESSEGSGMWPPLRKDPVLSLLQAKLRAVQLPSVELHLTVMFAFELTYSIDSLDSTVPSFSRLFLLGSLFSESPVMPTGSSQQHQLLDTAIIENAKASVGPIVDKFDLKDIELVGKAWGVGNKYVRTRYFIEMIRLGKDSSIGDLISSSSAFLDKSLFVEEVVQIVSLRIDATITSLKRTKNYRSVVSLLDADTCRWVREEAALTSNPQTNRTPVSLITTHALVLRVQSICQDTGDGNMQRRVDQLSQMSGTLLKAVQEQEHQQVMNV
jgi:hypothetical protein